jgi:hypothetical protein
MKPAGLTLKEFFLYRQKDLSTQALKQVEETRKYSALKEKLGQATRSLHWPGAFDLTMKSLGKLLEETGLYDIIANAWRENEEFGEFSDPEQHPPDETILVPLADHTIRSEHHPYLEIMLDQKVLGRIDVKIELTLNAKGFILEINRGELQSVQTGTLNGEGRVFCEGIQLLRRDTGEVQLPGKIDCSEWGER